MARVIHVVGQELDPAFFVSTGPRSLNEGLSRFPIGDGKIDGQDRAAKPWTLFVEDVDQLTASTQDLLLYFLSVVGATEHAQARVRLIATTTTDLRRRVVAGQFKDELFYRMNVLHVVLPPVGVVGPTGLSQLLDEQARLLLAAADPSSNKSEEGLRRRLGSEQLPGAGQLPTLLASFGSRRQS